ncbi:histidine kinase-dna gyrase b-and hsp90-like domain protein [Stylonychia lemnae]|uniref:Histidine kinase-dna gyrase b-and hsp90-like domain protein n=1 Tax=Stylonychia lemnae TaxID=5949 RepID=A0A078A7W0_STYLE|nr:histidine kinase-dna gyrase b-and hsp90-like domain protein [Stylonychia lemnae]|eukprot:CDW78339.1 histidine kinase-dna gyrase b-and hsp90-like domain protein [Stylonychia lemnae]
MFNDQTQMKLKIKEWKKNFNYIGGLLPNGEKIAIFIDTTRQKSSELPSSLNSLQTKIQACKESVNTLYHLIHNLNALYKILTQISKKTSLKLKLQFKIQQAPLKCKPRQKELISTVVLMNQYLGTNQFKTYAFRFIECDKGRLWQILFILVYNAIKYTNQGYVKIIIESYQQDLELEDENCQILNIKIQDSGCGILKENAPNIFKFLHNIKQKQNVNQNGMGLGLTICGKIIKAWGGQIDFKSVVGDGTEFDLKIPFKNVQSDSDGSLRLQSFDKVSKYNLNPKTFSDLNQSTKYRILLVDDDAFNLYSLGLLIKTRGNYKCDNVMNGYDAIKRLKDSFKLKEEPYRLILMDLNMPLIDGMQTSIILRQLHESHEIDLTNTKIFLHSAIQHTLEDKDGVFDGILEKPISFKELDGILSSL